MLVLPATAGALALADHDFEHDPYYYLKCDGARLRVVEGDAASVGKHLVVDPHFTNPRVATSPASVYLSELPAHIQDCYHIEQEPIVNGVAGLSYSLHGAPSIGMLTGTESVSYSLVEAQPYRDVLVTDAMKGKTVGLQFIVYYQPNPDGGSDAVQYGSASKPLQSVDTTVPAAYAGTRINVSKLSVGYMKTMAYNGKRQFPASLTVRYKNANVDANEIKITMGTNKRGTGWFKITGKGRFTGTKKYTFKIKKLSKASRLKLAKKEAARLAKIIKSNTKAKKDRAMITFMVANVYLQTKQSSKAYKKNFGNEAYAAFALGRAACSGQVRALILMNKELGISSKHVNANTYTHQWAKVNVGTKAKPVYWTVDPQGGTIDTDEYVPSWFWTDEENGRYMAYTDWQKRVPEAPQWPTSPSFRKTTKY
ncbi:MAG: hypothetical protein LBS17_00145 [Actinomycetes bacterium]|nr:hypothetical protein [Actinomycetes bacterium]